MMRVCGSSKWGRQALAAAFTALIAGVAVAAETWVQDVPDGDAYVAAAVVVPGCEGAEFSGERGENHVEFRVGFGPDLKLSVNGVDAGGFDPSATYSISVACQRVGQSWFASTVVVNEDTGEPAFCQANYKLPGAAGVVRATALDVIALSVR